MKPRMSLLVLVILVLVIGGSMGLMARVVIQERALQVEAMRQRALAEQARAEQAAANAISSAARLNAGERQELERLRAENEELRAKLKEQTGKT